MIVRSRRSRCHERRHDTLGPIAHSKPARRPRRPRSRGAAGGRSFETRDRSSRNTDPRRRLGWTREEIVEAARGDVQDELHEEPHEPHDDEPHTGTRGDLAELLAIGLGALSDETVQSLANSFTGLTAISATSMVSGALRREAWDARRGSGRVTPTTTTRALASDERGAGASTAGSSTRKRARVASKFLFRSRRFRGAARGVGDPVSTRVQ